jgi:glycosyltransferase involved in cell wall biosynthesis
MPPMLYPRSIQVSRLLSALARIGWEITVICNDPQNSSGNDATLSSLYDAGYRKINVLPDLSRRADALMSPWLEPALQSARTEMMSNEYSALITFAQPWVDHLIGLELHKEANIPWIAHFSDPWVDSPYYAGVETRQLNEWKGLERAVVSNSSAVIFTNSQAMALVMHKYPFRWKRKSFVIPHAFDADLSQKLKNERPVNDDRLCMVYTGDLYAERSAVGLLEALSALSKERSLAKELNIKFIGRSAKNEEQMVREMGLEDVIEFYDQLPYVKSLQACAECDILLLIDAPSSKPSPFLPSKLVDYLMFAKPIFGLTSNKGASADLLERLGCTIVSPNDVPSIIRALVALMDHERAETLKVADAFNNVVSAYHSDNVALSLDKILHGVTAVPSKFWATHTVSVK